MVGLDKSTPYRFPLTDCGNGPLFIYSENYYNFSGLSLYSSFDYPTKNIFAPLKTSKIFFVK